MLVVQQGLAWLASPHLVLPGLFSYAEARLRTEYKTPHFEMPAGDWRSASKKRSMETPSEASRQARCRRQWSVRWKQQTRMPLCLQSRILSYSVMQAFGKPVILLGRILAYPQIRLASTSMPSTGEMMYIALRKASVGLLA